MTFLEACRLKPVLKMIHFRTSEDGMAWIATDGQRCIQAPTLEECTDKAARIVNWQTGDFPREEQRNSLDKRPVNE